ncbi:hypothetical protein [Natronorubrum sp. DTA28]|uniref:hypothetical protein n=1 Tax=Natronorubrum sp. DTA28 TaxID=3447019 RepID=UPI003F85913A
MPDENDLDSSAVVYLRDLEETREQRHKENIQFLAAIGILGAYITIISTEMDFSWTLNAVIQLIGGSSFVFLMYKLIVNSPIPFVDRDAIPKIDALFSGLYVISIVLFAGVFITVVVASELNIEVTNTSEIAMALVMVSFIVFLVGMMYVLGTKKAQLAIDQAEALMERMPVVLENLENAEAINSGRKEALVDRTEAVLNRDGDPHWFLMHGMLTADSEPLRLTTERREQLLNILDRIDKKAKYNEYDETDIELLEAIISRAEETTQRGTGIGAKRADQTS